MKDNKSIQEITGLIPEEELEEDLNEVNGGTSGWVSAISAVTLVTAQTPCPSSACSKEC